MEWTVNLLDIIITFFFLNQGIYILYEIEISSNQKKFWWERISIELNISRKKKFLLKTKLINKRRNSPNLKNIVFRIFSFL